MKTVVIADEKFKEKFEGLFSVDGYEFISINKNPHLIDAALKAAREGTQVVIVQIDHPNSTRTQLGYLQPFANSMGVANAMVWKPFHTFIICKNRQLLAEICEKLRQVFM